MTSTDDARLLLSRAIQVIPDLTTYGIGIPEERKERRERGLDFVKEETARLQAELYSHLDEIALCADWLRDMKPIKTINKYYTSYGHKHRVEMWCESRGISQHIYNGSFIAAAVGLGFRFAAWGPNPHFNFSKQSLKQLETSARAA